MGLFLRGDISLLVTLFSARNVLQKFRTNVKGEERVEGKTSSDEECNQRLSLVSLTGHEAPQSRSVHRR